MLNSILKILLIFILGAMGGIWAQIFLLPYLAKYPFFQFINEFKEKEIILNPITEITIRENVALEKAIKKAKKAVIGVRTVTKGGKILKGSALIVTSDGLIVTLADLLPRGSDFYFMLNDKRLAYQILKKDLKNNLALVKVKESNLSTVSFANFKEIKLGERVFLVGVEFSDIGSPSLRSIIVNEGIIKSLGENLIETNIIEKTNLSGSPLFDIEGRVVGICIIDKDGQVFAIPISIVKEFTGLK